jgi:hypothetical protein
MRLAAFAVVAALLVGSAAAWGGYTQPAFPIPKRNVTVKTLNNNLINQGTIRGFSSLPGKLVRGEFVVKAPGKATPKVEVRARTRRRDAGASAVVGLQQGRGCQAVQLEIRRAQCALIPARACPWAHH